MAYKQRNNPFKKVDFTRGIGSGAYSTADGDLMSGTKAGLGKFGTTDTRIGRRNKEGDQEIFDMYTGSRVGRDIDRSNKGMKPFPERRQREGLSSYNQRMRSANYVDRDPVEASMPAVDVTPQMEADRDGTDDLKMRYADRRSRRADAQARRQARRAARQKARQDRAKARRDAREQRRQQRQAARARR